MTPLVPLALFGWVPLTILLFFILKPHQAVLVSVIGGWLLLPVSAYNLLGLPPYSKETAIALGLIIGGRLSGQRRAALFKWKVYDLPMLLWCFCPIASSLANHLGFYDGLSGAWTNTITWGIPYLAGRIYFDNLLKLRDLCSALVIGGLLYLPLCLYEIRMSPQLSKIIYGFFPHSFAQHVRHGGYRPVVFMQHGLMVALWMATTTTAAFWLWRSGEIKHVKGIPMSLLIIALASATVLCKSVNGYFALIMGGGGFFIYRYFKSSQPFRLLLLVFPCYIILRVTGGISGVEIQSIASQLVEASRVDSLAYRLLQEERFVERTLVQPVLGWGGYERGWPVDPETGEKIKMRIDSLWLIVINSRGFFGIISLSAGMLIGPWLVLRSFQKRTLNLDFAVLGPVLLSIIVILFMIDSLANGMVNPVYILISGTLVGWHVHQQATLFINKVPSIDAKTKGGKTCE